MVRRSSAGPGVKGRMDVLIELLKVLLVFRLVELGILSGLVTPVVVMLLPFPVPFDRCTLVVVFLSTLPPFSVLLIALELRTLSMLLMVLLILVTLLILGMLVLGMCATLMVIMDLLCVLIQELRNTVIVLGQCVSLVDIQVFGNAVSCTPMPLQLISLFRLCGMVMSLLCASMIPAAGLVSSLLTRLGLSCWLIRQLTLFRVSGRNGSVRASVRGEKRTLVATEALHVPPRVSRMCPMSESSVCVMALGRLMVSKRL